MFQMITKLQNCFLFGKVGNRLIGFRPTDVAPNVLETSLRGQMLNLLVRSFSFGRGIIDLHFFVGFVVVEVDVRLVDADDGLVEQAVGLLHVLRHDLKHVGVEAKNIFHLARPDLGRNLFQASMK